MLSIFIVWEILQMSNRLTFYFTKGYYAHNVFHATLLPVQTDPLYLYKLLYILYNGE